MPYIEVYIYIYVYPLCYVVGVCYIYKILFLHTISMYGQQTVGILNFRLMPFTIISTNMIFLEVKLPKYI